MLILKVLDDALKALDSPMISKNKIISYIRELENAAAMLNNSSDANAVLSKILHVCNELGAYVRNIHDR